MVDEYTETINRSTIYGRVYKKRMREAHLGQTLSPEARRKVSAALRKRPRSWKLYCKHGHKFTLENMYIRPDGYKDCRECRKRRMRKYQEKAGS